MKILVWTVGDAGVDRRAMTIDLLFPKALKEMGHEVIIFPFHFTGRAQTEEPLRSDLADIVSYPLSELESFLPTDIFIFAAAPHNFFTVKNAKQFIPLLEKIRERTEVFVYYALDLWEAWRADLKKETLQVETYLCDLATHFMAVSPQLCIHLSKRYRKVFYWLPNAMRLIWFRGGVPPQERTNIAIAVGGMHPYFDVKSIKELATQYKDWLFYVIGYIPAGKEEGAKSHSSAGNYFVLPVKIGQRLFSFSLFTRAGIISGKRSIFNYFGDTTKWYFYHALGLPVVEGLPQPHHELFPNFYPRTYTGYSLAEAFKKYLERDDGAYIPPMEIHDWSHRARAFLSILDSKENYGYAKDGKFVGGDFLP